MKTGNSPSVVRLVTIHSLFWLWSANLVGVWLAAVLLWPALGDLVAPLTYGRWMPLHLNWQLYGWCSLPLVGVLLYWCLDERHGGARVHARIALGAWSLALILGGASWLGGLSSGKPFLDWRGWARGLLPAAMIVLWTVLAAHTWWRRNSLGTPGRILRIGILLALAVVPPALFLSSGPDIYPAVNPDSGGATGAALLGSTLGVVTVFGLLPVMLARKSTTTVSWFWGALALSWGIFAALDHGSTSHHSVQQIAGLGLLLGWIPLLIIYWRKFDWPVDARRWLVAGMGWWLLLVATGWLTFLPGISERLKFTNGLVAHTHLAMAGLVTSVNAAILHTLGGGWKRDGSFWLWQGGCVVYVALMMTLGFQESENAGALFRSEAWTQFYYTGRLISGLAMTFASGRWFWEALK